MDSVPLQLFPLHGSVRIDFDPAGQRSFPPAILERIDALWTSAMRENPRLFDGPALDVLDFNFAAQRLRCAPTSYKIVTVARELGLPTRQLGVKAILIGCDAAGEPHVLLARRGSETRTYPGQWECAPAGGVPLPPPDRTSINQSGLIGALQAEAHEELGLTLDGHFSITMILADDEACSVDVVFRVDLNTPINPRRLPCFNASASDQWEYVDAAWVPVGGIKEFVLGASASISPPTLVMLTGLTHADPTERRS